jgi:prepilin-type N-terminal cleavage/methylation domain-containing protein
MYERATNAARHACRRAWRRGAAQDGFTLAEMLVVLAILGTILAGLTQLLTSATNSQVDQTNRVGAQQEARLALEALRREIHCAMRAVSATAPSSRITVTLDHYCPSAGTTLTTGATFPTLTSFSAADASAFDLTGAGTIVYLTSPTGTLSGQTQCTRSGNTFTGCSGGAPGSYPVGSRLTATANYTWCTKNSNGTAPAVAGGGPYSLWRYNGVNCSGTGKMWADNLIETSDVSAGQIFTYVAPAAGLRARVSVNLSASVAADATKQQFILKDDIVLRNSPRS